MMSHYPLPFRAVFTYEGKSNDLKVSETGGELKKTKRHPHLYASSRVLQLQWPQMEHILCVSIFSIPLARSSYVHVSHTGIAVHKVEYDIVLFTIWAVDTEESIQKAVILSASFKLLDTLHSIIAMYVHT